jgi:hypothetical protein
MARAEMRIRPETVLAPQLPAAQVLRTQHRPLVKEWE